MSIVHLPNTFVGEPRGTLCGLLFGMPGWLARGESVTQHVAERRDVTCPSCIAAESKAEGLPRPLIVVTEIPQDDPTVDIISGDVEIITLSTYHFSSHASQEECEGAIDSHLSTLQDPSIREDYRAFLRKWLLEMVGSTNHDVDINWDTLTRVDPDEPGTAHDVADWLCRAIRVDILAGKIPATVTTFEGLAELVGDLGDGYDVHEHVMDAEVQLNATMDTADQAKPLVDLRLPFLWKDDVLLATDVEEAAGAHDWPIPLDLHATVTYLVGAGADWEAGRSLAQSLTAQPDYESSGLLQEARLRLLDLCDEWEAAERNNR